MARKFNPFRCLLFFSIVCIGIFLVRGGTLTGVEEKVQDSAAFSSISTTCSSTSGETDESCKANLYAKTDSNENESQNNATTTEVSSEKEESLKPTNNNDEEEYTITSEEAENVASVPGTATTCIDNNEQCNFWADNGQCENSKSKTYMMENCRKSCQLCSDSDDKESAELSRDELEVGSDMGVAQDGLNYGSEEVTEKIRNHIQQAREYMKKARRTLHPDLMESCTNKHAKCTDWAILGECDKNPNYMKRHCAPVCNSCDFLDISERCKFDPADHPDVWGPGDLNKMFEKLTSEPYLSEYSIEVLSSPNTTGGPWLISFENFLSEHEAERLIELGGIRGYKRSTGVGKLQADGTHEAKVISTRTSTNAWCEDECYTDEVTQTVINRISNLTDTPEKNSEYLQLLRYEEGQFYNTHHDCIVDHGKRKIGVRILTAYMYLNDVPGGGETRFPKLGLTVKPKRGRMVIWPSVYDDRPNEKDDRTVHSAEIVTEGVKYGANAWIHLRDYKTPHKAGCN